MDCKYIASLVQKNDTLEFLLFSAIDTRNFMLLTRRNRVRKVGWQ